jgi:hypothetical protein
LGVSVSRPAILDLATVETTSGNRRVWSMVHGRWRGGVPLRGEGAGPMPGGPVRVDKRVYLTATDASAQPWKMSVHVLERRAWRPVDGRLNRSAGNAQGTLSLVGRSVWAAWQEQSQREDGRFETVLWAQRVAPTGDRAKQLWRGVSIGPGSIEVVAGAGRTWALYQPSAMNGSALTVAVKPLP